jgi:hypothetical protein
MSSMSCPSRLVWWMISACALPIRRGMAAAKQPVHSRVELGLFCLVVGADLRRQRQQHHRRVPAQPLGTSPPLG